MKNNTKTLGIYYQISSVPIGGIFDIKESFIYADSSGLYDSRQQDYWINVKDYTDDIKTIEEYCCHYSVEVVPVSVKKVILTGLDKCYADRIE